LVFLCDLCVLCGQVTDAAKLYEDAVLSAGQAAEVANLSKRAFIEVMGQYGVSPFSAEPENLLEDIRNA
jgi:hypothetical protein